MTKCTGCFYYEDCSAESPRVLNKNGLMQSEVAKMGQMQNKFRLFMLNVSFCAFWKSKEPL